MTSLREQHSAVPSERPGALFDRCDLGKVLLHRATRLRDELDRIVKSLEEEHLNCCLFPRLDGAAEILRAVRQLSLSRIGALIAVERKTRLDIYASSGTAVDAELSAPLLISLFFPAAPLHDGAVIIRGTRILAAGCVLPLDTGDMAHKTPGLGTRHRAGLGLARVSDAVVYIVSEQSGNISLAFDGELYREPDSRWRLDHPDPMGDDPFKADWREKPRGAL